MEVTADHSKDKESKLNPIHMECDTWPHSQSLAQLSSFSVTSW